MSGSCACGGCADCTSAGRQPDRAFLFRHSQLRRRMLQAIATTMVEEIRPLAALGTRAGDDPAVALIDAQAACLHILGWNCRRLEEDSSIRHTEDRDALVSLTRLLGAEPRPALAASTTLAFTLEAFGAPTSAVIPVGTAVATVPRAGELPQTFETDAEIEGRSEWNALLPVQRYQSGRIEASKGLAEIEGVDTPVRQGDHLLLRGDTMVLARVTLVERIAEAPKANDPGRSQNRTRLHFTPLPQGVEEIGGPVVDDPSHLIILGQHAAAFGSTAPDPALMPRDMAGITPAGPILDNNGQKIGDSAARWNNYVVGAPGADSPYFQLVDLDAVYSEAVRGRAIVFIAGELTQAGTISGSEERSRADFALSAKITRVEVQGILLDPKDEEKGFRNRVRETLILIETARATLFRDLIDEPLPSDPQVIDVRGTVLLAPGRRILLAGKEWSATGAPDGESLAEIAEVERCETLGANTRLHLKRAVSGRFRSTTLTLNANCAPASHGESIRGDPEILGSGSGTSAFPAFDLARAPLAYVPADNARGYAPAIEVRVDGRRYQDVPTLYGQPAGERIITIRQQGGGTRVQFAGRLPSGTFNVTARYRTGGGSAGLVESGRISTILTPVLHVLSATNPMPTEGGSDAATLEELRELAPRSVQTLERVVSLADFEAFAREFRGVGKAMASEMREGMRSVVRLTIANTKLSSPLPTSDLVGGLLAALAKMTVPGRKVTVDGFDDYLAVLDVALAVEPDRRREDVESAVRAALVNAFGKPARRFGEALFKSMILSVVQNVRGVRAARIKSWDRAIAKPPFTPEGIGASSSRLPCPGPSAGGRAGLLSVSSDHLNLSEFPL
nr:baseplate J/gp47 family protein [uncultured Sphingomonas sp.]